MPIYKVEPYLRRCLDSIVNQTYTNLEIILVDDGSPDGCPQICDMYAAKDNRIVVIHKNNGGLSDARNAGLNICKGIYISFVDSDDWVGRDYIKILVNNAKKEQADIVIEKFIKTNSEGNQINREQKNNLFSAVSLNNKQSVGKLFDSDCVFFGTAWGKIYARELFNNIRFPLGLIHEDEYTLYKLLYNSRKTIFLDAALYFYFQRSSSIMGTASPSSIRALRAKVERYFFFKEKNEPDIQELCLKNLCWDLLFAYGKDGLDKKSVGYSSRKELLAIMNSCQKDHWQSNSPLVEKLILRFFTHFPHLYELYQKKSPIKIRRI